MKRTIKVSLFMAAIVFAVSVNKTRAQTSAAMMHQKDMIGENPTADKDIQNVTNFSSWLVGGDADKAATLLSPKATHYGPGPDSANNEQLIKTWKENYKTQSDRKVDLAAESFRVLSGPFKGDWVATWGDYTFTSNGKTVKFPYQCTYLVGNGKILTSRIYYDNLYILTKLGYTLTPPAVSK